MSQNSLKIFFGKVVFQILAKIEMMRNKNRLFDRHFGTVQFFCWIMVVISEHIHGVEMIKNSGGKVVFLGGSMHPLAYQQERKYLGQLSVKG